MSVSRRRRMGSLYLRRLFWLLPDVNWRRVPLLPGLADGGIVQVDTEGMNSVVGATTGAIELPRGREAYPLHSRAELTQVSERAADLLSGHAGLLAADGAVVGTFIVHDPGEGIEAIGGRGGWDD